MTRVLMVALLCGCAQDVSLNAIPNDPPSAIIASHEDGDTLLEAFVERVRAVVDDDDPVTELEVRWFIDEEETCSEPPDEQGDVVCDFRVPGASELRLRLEVRDAEGELATDQVDVAVQLTEAPAVTILSPEVDRRYYRNVPVSLIARVTDAEDGHDDLLVSWTSDMDGELDADAVPDSSDLAASTSLLTEGSHSLTATGTDSTGKLGEAQVTIDVGPDNRPPECGILAPEDGTTQTYDVDLPFLATATDPDVDPSWLQIAVSSSVDGLLVEGAPDAEGGIDTTVRLSRGVHTVTLVVTDDAGATCEDSVTVDASNSAPTAPEVVITPNPATALDDLLCSVTADATDAEGDPLTYVFTWLRDGVDQSELAVTTSLEGDTIEWEDTAAGQVWTCEVRASDGLAEGAAGIAEVELSEPAVERIAVGITHACQVDNADVLTCWGGEAFGALALTGGRYLDVTTGANHTCAIQPSREIVCVGRETDGRTDTSGLVGPFTDLDAGDAHTCAVDGDGEVQCWGNNVEGQLDAPPGPFVEVAGGFRHTCARNSSNEVTCWGSDVFGRSTPPVGIELVSISAGDQHSCGLDTSGTVHCWGSNSLGQLLGPGGSFVHVSAGEKYTCGVQSTGAVACWGAFTGPGEINEAPGGRDYVTVEAGKNLTCALRTDGLVDCWGDNEVGQADAPTEWW